MKESAAICFNDFNRECGLGEGMNEFLTLEYVGYQCFRCFLGLNGFGCYLWGIDKVKAHDNRLNFSLGIKPCSFSMDTSFKEIDSIYVPYPLDTKFGSRNI